MLHPYVSSALSLLGLINRLAELLGAVTKGLRQTGALHPCQECSLSRVAIVEFLRC